MLKKICLFSLIIFFAKSSFSQITIDTSNLPVSGTAYETGIDTMPLISIGIADINAQVWDFRNLSADKTDSISFSNPTSTVYGSNFPSADMAVAINLGFTDAIGYLIKDLSGLYSIGLGMDLSGFGISGIDTIIGLANPTEQIFTSPMTLGTTLLDTGRYYAVIDKNLGDGCDTTFAHYTTKIITADAWGTLITCSGNFNILRVYESTIIVDSLYIEVPPLCILGPISLELFRDTTYRYWYMTDSSIYKYPLVFVTTDANDSISRSVEFIRKLFDTCLIVSIHKTELINTNAKIYPNPANETVILHFENHAKRKYSLKIHNVLGRQIFEDNMEAFNQPVIKRKYDVSAFHEGIYLFRLMDDAGIKQQSGYFVIIR